jgi:hypothetical protein
MMINRRQPRGKPDSKGGGVSDSAGKDARPRVEDGGGGGGGGGGAGGGGGRW